MTIEFRGPDLPKWTFIDEGKLKDEGTRYKARSRGAHLPTPWLFGLRNAQTIRQTTAWTAVFSPLQAVWYSPYCLSQSLVYTLKWGAP